ncbi:hypothetical protein ABZ202_27375 [Streptomyces sp. NPDC006186]|jgi:hypothetical protein|uniref:hypothetical protein n=1 Tax=Streptomyces sp. NPDC006186 TaxID=3155248 RepID=UPI00339E67CD
MSGRIRKATVRAVALTLVCCAATAGCGSGNETTGLEQVGTPSPTAEASTAAGASADQLVAQANDTMRSLGFTAVGTTTSFDGGMTVIEWNPDQGLHMTYSATADSRQELFCKGSTQYTSASMAAKALESSRNIHITVPDRIADKYVESTLQEPQTCQSLFLIPEGGAFAPEKDATVNGVRSRAVAYASPRVTDVYYISVDEPARLMKLRSTANGRTSNTIYSGFGKKPAITFPRPDQILTMSEFRSEVTVS